MSADTTFDKLEWDVQVEQVMAIQQLVMMTDIAVLNDLLRNMRKADTLVPVLDPTLYMQRGRTNRHNQACIEAFLTYRKTLDGIKEGMSR